MVTNSISQDVSRRESKCLAWERRCLAWGYPSAAQTKRNSFTNCFNRPKTNQQHALVTQLRDLNSCLFAYGFFSSFSLACFLFNLHNENDQVALGNYALGLILNVGRAGGKHTVSPSFALVSI